MTSSLHTAAVAATVLAVVLAFFTPLTLADGLGNAAAASAPRAGAAPKPTSTASAAAKIAAAMSTATSEAWAHLLDLGAAMMLQCADDSCRQPAVHQQDSDNSQQQQQRTDSVLVPSNQPCTSTASVSGAGLPPYVASGWAASAQSMLHMLLLAAAVWAGLGLGVAQSPEFVAGLLALCIKPLAAAPAEQHAAADDPRSSTAPASFDQELALVCATSIEEQVRQGSLKYWAKRTRNGQDLFLTELDTACGLDAQLKLSLAPQPQA